MKKILFFLLIAFSAAAQTNNFNWISQRIYVGAGTNTYTATIQGLPSYTVGLELKIQFTNANTGASTFQINALAAVPLQKNGTALASGDIASGGIYRVTYDGANFQVLGIGGSGGGGVTDHGALTGLADDDHTQYLNNTRGDARYPQLTRNITINGTSGRITSSAGSQSLAADRTWTLDLATAGTAGTYRSVTTDAYGRVTAGTNPTTLSSYGITDQIYLRGGNNFGANSILGLTDNFNLTLQTGNANLLFNTNATARGGIYSDGKFLLGGTDNTPSTNTIITNTPNFTNILDLRNQAGNSRWLIDNSGGINHTVIGGGTYVYSNSASVITSMTATATSPVVNNNFFRSTYNLTSSSSTPTITRNISANATLNTTGSFSGTYVFYDIESTLTSTSGLTLIGYRAPIGQNVFGASALDDANVRMQIRGSGNGSDRALLVEAQNGTDVLEVESDGTYIVNGTTGTNGQVLTTNSSGVPTWQTPAGGGTYYAPTTLVANATDANFTATVNGVHNILDGVASANRVITIPTGSDGDVLKFYNTEDFYTWSFSGATVYLADRVTVQTTLLYNVPCFIEKIDGLWIITN